MGGKIEVIFFDLDGTLLDVDMGIFISHYFGMMSARVAHLLSPERFISCLLQASQAMVANDGRASNQAVFEQAFYPLVGCSRDELETVLARFYVQDFPRLRQYVQRKPQARGVVQATFDLGYQVVVATNPLFPATAIEQRMEWAGVAGFPYRRVTTYENSRAAKPNLLYYELLLREVGQPPEACLMVGDEDMDMVAARLGCPTFLVPSPNTELDPTTPKPTYHGDLAALQALLSSWR